MRPDASPIIGQESATPARRVAAISDPGKEGRLAVGIPVVPAFDGYRAYAVLAIVALHVLIFSGVLPVVGDNWFFRLVQGTLGQSVDVLFIISGFVVFLPTVARGGDFGSLRAYAIRRAARLVPAYWAMLAIVLLLVGLVTVGPPITLPGVGSVLVHGAFLQTPVQMFRSYPMGFGVDGAVWTLSLEVTFYLLLPLVASWYSRRPLIGLALAGTVTALWHEAIIHYSALSSLLGVQPSAETSFLLQVNALYQFPFFAFSFAAGMTGAWAYVRLSRLYPADALSRRVLPVQIASLAALIVFAVFVGRSAAESGSVLAAQAGRLSPIVALGYSASLTTLMVATALRPATWQRAFANRVTRWLGDVSYGIYLVHLVIITYALRAFSLSGDGGVAGLPGPGVVSIPGDGSLLTLAVLAGVVVPTSILYGYLSARFLEQPIRRWARRFGRQHENVSRPECAGA